MKSYLYPRLSLFLQLIFLSLAHQVSSQCGMIHIPIETQINESSLVIEGEVTGRRTIVTDDQQHIYTAYKIKVTKVFKGDLEAHEIELIEVGGTTSEMTLHVEPRISLYVGQTGTFMLSAPRARPLRSMRFAMPAFEGYASMQSVFTYNLDRTVVEGVFEKRTYAEWYTTIAKSTGAPYKSMQELTPLTTNRTSAAPQIDEVSPLTVTAGTNSYMYIWGYNFGSTPGTVYFKNPDDGGNSYVPVSPVHIETWSDNVIVLLVPTTAGSGQVAVSVNSQVGYSTESVQITYNLLNFEVEYQDVTWLLHSVLRKNQLSGAFQFQFNTDFSNNILARRAFMRAFDSWRCEVDVNFKMGAVTTQSYHAMDNVSVISFDHNDPLPPGVVGRAFVAGPVCWTNDYGAMPVTDMDILFDDNPSGGWHFNYWYPEQLDFESVALHELGHCMQLRHVLEPDQVMWPTILPGDAKRSLTPNDVLGAIDARTRGETYPAYCSNNPITEYVANRYIDLTTTNTVQSGDSWATALPFLQDVLQVAYNNACFDTLFIAEGIHLPDDGWFQGDNNSSSATFDITKPMIMMGGYPAGGGARDIEEHPTILSGDVDENNVHDGSNSTNVVKVNANMTMDGFVIEHGFADANGGSGSVGAGLTNNSNCTLRNIIFRKNKARGSIVNPNGKGGAIYNAAGNLTVINGLFYQNEATQHGNALSVAAGVFEGTNCTFANNGPTVNTLHFAAGANKLRNSITWHNNTGNDYLITSPATLQFTSTMLEETIMPQGATGTDTWLGRDPLFEDESAQNYRIEYCSPAMNRGTNSFNTHPIDVVGNPRQQAGVIDRGAYESSHISPSGSVTTTADSGPGSLRTVLANQCEYNGVVFHPNLNGATIQLTSGPIIIDKEMSLFGLGQNNLTISAGGLSHLFEVVPSKYFYVGNVTLAGGASQSGYGNCIKNSGILYLSNMRMQSHVGAPTPYTLANSPSAQTHINGTVNIR